MMRAILTVLKWIVAGCAALVLLALLVILIGASVRAVR